MKAFALITSLTLMIASMSAGAITHNYRENLYHRHHAKPTVIYVEPHPNMYYPNYRYGERVYLRNFVHYPMTYSYRTQSRPMVYYSDYRFNDRVYWNSSPRDYYYYGRQYTPVRYTTPVVRTRWVTGTPWGWGYDSNVRYTCRALFNDRWRQGSLDMGRGCRVATPRHGLMWAPHYEIYVRYYN